MLCLNQGFAIRYFLKTDFLQKLIVEKFKIVLLSSFTESNSFASEFKHEAITLEFLDIKSIEKITKTKIYTLLYYCRIYGLNLSVSVAQKLKREKVNASKNGFWGLVKFYILYVITGALRSSAILREIFIWIDKTYKKEIEVIGPLLKKHQPDVIILPSMGFIFPDVHIIKVAKVLKIPVYVSVISWDNTTTKGMTTAQPTHVFAWTQIMKNELVYLHNIQDHKITVSGVPNFDVHFRDVNDDFKQKLFFELNIKHQDKYIFLGLGSPTYQHEPNIETIQLILENINSKKLKIDKLVVRLHPNYISNRRRQRAFEMESFLQDMKSKYSEILVINKPFKSDDEENWYSSENDIFNLSLLLRNSSAVVCFYSTLILEASIFDIPLLNISYDAEGFTKNNNNSSGRSYTHIKRLFSYGGVVEVNNKDELIEKIQDSLANPKNLSSKRGLIRELECGIFFFL